MRGPKKFCKRESNFDNVFLYILFSIVDEGRKDPNTTIIGPTSPFLFCFIDLDQERKDLDTTISGPSMARQRNAI